MLSDSRGLGTAPGRASMGTGSTVPARADTTRPERGDKPRRFSQGGDVEADSARQCAGTNADGSPCRAPAELLLESGYCWTHDPDVPEAEKIAAKRNGGATMRLKARRGLDPEELGELQTPEDALRWAFVIARAGATGRLSAGAVTAVRGALSVWVAARDLHIKETELTKLAATVKRLEGKL